MCVRIREGQMLDLHEGMNHTPRQTSGLLLVGLALLGALGTGCSAKNPNQTQPTTIEMPATNPTPTATPEESILSGEVEKYNSVMDKYKEMSVESFEELPRDERLLYSQYLIDQTTSRGTYDRLYSGESKDLAITPVKASAKNSGQNILDGNLYALQVSYGQFIENETVRPQGYDLSDGNKVLSSVYYEVGQNKLVSKQYVAVKADQGTLDEPAQLTNRYDATNTSDLRNGVDSTGDNVKYKVVTYVDNSDSKTWLVRFVYHNFTSYDGSRQAVWLFDTKTTGSLQDLRSIGSVR